MAVDGEKGCYFVTISLRYHYEIEDRGSLEKPTNEITDKVQLTYNTFRKMGTMYVDLYETPLIVNARNENMFTQSNLAISIFRLTEDNHIAILVRLMGMLDASLTARELNMKIRYGGVSRCVIVLGMNSQKTMSCRTMSWSGTMATNPIRVWEDT